jgi:hypothetical protein
LGNKELQKMPKNMMKAWPTLKDLRTTAMKAMVLTYIAIMAVWWIKGYEYEPILGKEWFSFVWVEAAAITIICSICLRRSNKMIAFAGFLAVIVTVIWSVLTARYTGIPG